MDRLRGRQVVLAAVLGWTLACGADLDTDAVDEPLVDVPGDDLPEAPEPAAEPVPVVANAGVMPLAVGHTWTYEVRQRKGAGARILLIPTKKAEHTKLADWTLTVAEQTDDGWLAKLSRVPVGDELPSTTEIRLWERDGSVWMDAGKGERPAFELAVPPDPVSSERVRCVAHVLGGVVGTCPPVSGGPLGVAPGLEHGVVAEDIKPGAVVGQFLVGLVSVGLFIPGNQSRVETATLTGFTAGEGSDPSAASPSPLLVELRSGGKLARLVEKHPVDAEQAAAVIREGQGHDAVDRARLLLPALPEDARYGVVRTALQLGMDDGGAGGIAAKLLPLLPDPIPEDQREALVAAVDDEVGQKRVGIVVSGENPVFAAVLANTEGPFDSDRLTALEDALAVHPVTAAGAPEIVGLFAFDGGRRDAIERLLPGIPADEQAKTLSAMIQRMSFDKGMLSAIEDHQDLLKTLPEEERRRLAKAVTFGADEAGALLGVATD